MNWRKISAISVVISTASGCSSGQSADPPPPLQRARDVQNTVDQYSNSTRKSVDEQERGDNTP